MSRPAQQSYEFGPFLIDMAERRLLHDGEPVRLTRKAFDTLLVLVENGGHVVEKEHLMKRVWPHANVEVANLTQTVFMLRKALGGSYIGTVPGRGYRFIADVKGVGLESGGALTRGHAAARPRGDEEGVEKTPDGDISLAVLPLADETEHPGAEHLCDRITEIVINNLSRLPRARVMARSTVFRYKGRAVDPLEAGRELGVQAVLTGRAFKSDDRLFISMELVDVARGWHLWGEQYSRKLSEASAAQEEVAREITGSLYAVLNAS